MVTSYKRGKERRGKREEGRRGGERRREERFLVLPILPFSQNPP